MSGGQLVEYFEGGVRLGSRFGAVPAVGLVVALRRGRARYRVEPARHPHYHPRDPRPARAEVERVCAEDAPCAGYRYVKGPGPGDVPGPRPEVFPTGPARVDGVRRRPVSRF